MINENTPYNQFQHMTLKELKVMLREVVDSKYVEDIPFIQELSEEIHRRQLAIPANE